MQRDMIDIVGGLVVAVVGLAVLGFTVATYDIGTPRRMGPGFFPAALGFFTLIIGAMIVASAFGRPTVPQDVLLRSAMWVFASVVGFMLGMHFFGLFAAIVLTTLLSSRADRDASLMETLLLAVGVCIGCWLIFSVGLGMPLPMIRTPF